MLKTEFSDYLRFELRYSDHTVKAYLNDVNDFQEFLSAKNLESVSKKDIKSYLAHLVDLKFQERSINRKLSSLRSYYKFLYLTEAITEMPTQGLKGLKHFKKVQIPFSENEMKVLLDSDLFSNDFIGIRDKTILIILYHTGIRRAELIELGLSDIDFENYQIKVIGKGDKERIIPANEELIQCFNIYINAALKESLDISNFLFVTENGKRLYPELVYRITNSYLSLVTTKRKKSPHMIRHTFATHMLNNGSDIMAIKDLLGHKSLASTEHYTHNDINQLKKVFNLAHPRERK